MCVCSLFQFIKHISTELYVYELTTGKNIILPTFSDLQSILHYT